MDGVPLRTPSTLQEVKEDMTVTVPNYLMILQETEYEFSLEKWVLTGLQSGFTCQLQPQPYTCSSGVSSSCPPYWMMFSSPQQSRLASRHTSDFWEPTPRQRSHSLTSTVLRPKFTVSDAEDEWEGSTRTAEKGASVNPSWKNDDSGQPGPKKAQKAFIPDLLNPPSCLSSLPHQRRKNLRHRSLSVLTTNTQHELNTDQWAQCAATPTKSSSRSPVAARLSNISNHTEHKTLEGTDSATLPGPWKRCSSALDCSAELLSALSPQERELLATITAQGYNLHTAIIALQRTGPQTPEKILSYLVACEHLCQLGYDMAQVEEALEMFENSETKAEQFLQLLSQFNEMGFQQNAIKEVLLVHENHRERALEELMMRVA